MIIATQSFDFSSDCASGHFAFADVTMQQSAFFYALIFSSALAGYGSLVTTLPDKKLISRRVEVCFIGVAGVVTLASNLCAAGGFILA